jgi:hypothetical protein
VDDIVTVWCPSYGAEYRSEFTQCADCGVALAPEHSEFLEHVDVTPKRLRSGILGRAAQHDPPDGRSLRVVKTKPRRRSLAVGTVRLRTKAFYATIEVGRNASRPAGLGVEGGS